MSCWLPAHNHCSLFVPYSASTYPKALHAVFQAIVVNKLSYASPAWWGSLLPMIGDVLEAFMRRSATLGYHEGSTLTFDSICTKTDDKLFSSITDNRHQLLHPLLPPQRQQHYSLRDRSHNLQLPTRTSSLKDNNFLIRMLYKDITFTCAFSQ